MATIDWQNIEEFVQRGWWQQIPPIAVEHWKLTYGLEPPAGWERRSAPAGRTQR